LAIPSAIISYTAYEKLHLENIYQYQQAARSITLDLNSTLTQAIAKEEERLDAEYSFLVVEGEPNAKFLQRSVLSRYPVESNFPGIVGYFQVDSNKRFSSPLLPDNRLGSKNSYGLSNQDLLLRNQLEQNLYSILAQNKLVAKKHLREHDAQIDITSDKEQINTLGFDLLESVIEQEKISREVGKQKGYKDKLSKDPQSISAPLEKKPRQSTLPNKPKRKEKSYIPQQNLVLKKQNSSTSSTNIEGEAQIVKPKNLNLFESELDPFRFSILKSGHFVVYRKVWRGENQLIQGAVLSIDDFFEQVIKPRFERSPLSEYTQLSIAYGNSTLTNYPKQMNNLLANRSFIDKSLYTSTSLSEPFDQLSLVFHATEIPTSESGQFIMLMTIILFLSLVFGTYALFRLTYRQSSLAQQHQDFVSSVSHELKTPITSIQMYGEILKKGWLDDIKREEYYDFICSESERLSRLISNILQISKVSRNSLSLDIKEISINELASLIHSKVDSQMQLSDFTYNFEMDPTIGDKKVKVENDAFIQIIINLVDNAIKYSRGSLKKQIDIKFNVLPNKKVTISVRDYGVGIKEEENNKVFELFYRIGNELTRQSKGTGIGLALVKELTNAMDGKVIIVNHSRGTEFKLTFMLLDK
jgi:signal transduction histidine kinase